MALVSPARQHVHDQGIQPADRADSAGVLDLVRRLDALTVVGNHEVALLEGRDTETLDQVRKQLGSSLAEWLAWLESLPAFICGRAPFTPYESAAEQPLGVNTAYGGRLGMPTSALS
jgi:hypothetical protein